jgi:hypothetical protein
MHHHPVFIEDKNTLRENVGCSHGRPAFLSPLVGLGGLVGGKWNRRLFVLWKHKLGQLFSKGDTRKSLRKLSFQLATRESVIANTPDVFTKNKTRSNEALFIVIGVKLE